MPIDNNTLIEDLSFPQAFRLRRAVNQYNRIVDKESRLKYAKDLLNWKKEDLIKMLGVGPKTAEYTVEFLKGLESCS
jgi:endonuclease III